MGIINQLDKQVAELIAAGEVIERPASIVKELVENSIDAQSTAITVEIKSGGTKFIRVTDNGTGMSKEDLSVAFIRHTTSKVRTIEDLNAIFTLGFRGEALASICAVAKVEMLSKLMDQPFGGRIVMESGEMVSLDEAGCPDGTTIIVRDLFYQVPARQKFLKKDVTEANAVQSIVEKLALSHPQISFRMIRENESTLRTVGDGSLKSAIYALLGKEMIAGMIPVEYSYQGIQVSGFVTKPENSRKTRAMQHFFVNYRYVKSATCSAAISQAYQHSIMVSKFPACVLMIQMQPELMDINVHPAKIEIRFHQEHLVFETIYFAVKSALSSYDRLQSESNSIKSVTGGSLDPSLDLVLSTTSTRMISNKNNSKKDEKQIEQLPSPKMNQIGPIRLASPQAAYQVIESNQPLAKEIYSLKQEEHHFSYLEADSFMKKKQIDLSTREIDSSSLQQQMIQENDTEVDLLGEKEQQSNLKFVGEIYATYILFEREDCLIFMDKHAAHERILYETLREQVTLKKHQLLLEPLEWVLPTEQSNLPIEYQKELENLGFLCSVKNKNIRITHAPMLLCDLDLKEIIEELLEHFAVGHRHATPTALDELIHSMACRKAIMAKQQQQPEELMALAKQVYTNKKIRYCPHGRPVGFCMKKHEIEKKIGRVQ